MKQSIKFWILMVFMFVVTPSLVMWNYLLIRELAKEKEWSIRVEGIARSSEEMAKKSEAKAAEAMKILKKKG